MVRTERATTLERASILLESLASILEERKSPQIDNYTEENQAEPVAETITEFNLPLPSA